MPNAQESLRVAAIQVRSENGEPAFNLDNAEGFVLDAIERGAKLIVCPEFLASGYIFDESLWESAEPLEGPTECWLRDIAETHKVTIGAGFLHAEGEHFYNTFSLFGPTGEVLGRVRKGSLPFFEGWFFAPCPKPKVIETPHGRIAIGICNDNQTAIFLRQIIALEPDIILMPHSAPTPTFPLFNGFFTSIFDNLLRGIAATYAEALGVPVIMANKVSVTGYTMTRIPLIPGLRVPLIFHGYSSICDASGATLTTLKDEEGALVEDVVLDPRFKTSESPRPRGYWAFAPQLLGGVMGRLLNTLEALGQRAYRRNPRRARAAMRHKGD